MDESRQSPDPWWVAFSATALLATGLLLMADRYVELLGAVVAYAATWVIVRHERLTSQEEETR